MWNLPIRNRKVRVSVELWIVGEERVESFQSEMILACRMAG